MKHKTSIIKELFLDFQYQGHQTELEVMDKMHEAFETQIQPKLETIFKENDTNETFRVDRWELDLGVFDKWDVEEIGLAIEKQLLEKLFSLRHHKSGTKDSFFSSDDHGPALEILIFYLTSGVLPWNFVYQDSGSVKKLFKEVVENKAFVRQISLSLKSEEAMIRFLYQFSKELLNTFTESLAAEISSSQFVGTYRIIHAMVHRVGISSFDVKLIELKSLLQTFQGDFGSSSLMYIKTVLRELCNHQEIDKKLLTTEFIKVLDESPLKQWSDYRKEIIHLLQELQSSTPSEPIKKWLLGYENPGEDDQVRSAMDDLRVQGPDDSMQFTDLRPVDFYVENAGLILLWPFLPAYFAEIEIVKEEGFTSEESRKKAIHLLQFLITGQSQNPEYKLVLNKVLCDCPTSYPLDHGIDIGLVETQASKKLIASVINQWRALGNTSNEGFVSAFLSRSGKLTSRSDDWLLQVEQMPYDILMDHIPWPYHTVKLPWMQKPICVEW